MKKIHLLMLGLLTIMLSGCAQLTQTRWENSSSPSANFSIDEAQCSNEAMRAVPETTAQINTSPMLIVNSAPQQTSFNTRCVQGFNDITCNTRSSGINTAAHAAEFQNLTNQMIANNAQQDASQARINAGIRTYQNRSQYENNCLISKGWRKVQAQR